MSTVLNIYTTRKCCLTLFFTFIFIDAAANSTTNDPIKIMNDADQEMHINFCIQEYAEVSISLNKLQNEQAPQGILYQAILHDNKLLLNDTYYIIVITFDKEPTAEFYGEFQRYLTKLVCESRPCLGGNSVNRTGNRIIYNTQIDPRNFQKLLDQANACCMS